MRILSPLPLGLVVLLVGCKGSADERDEDGDGIVASEDCDDQDPDVGAGSLWYADGDGDGFGTPDTSEEACEAPEGYVDNDFDCDDTQAGEPVVVDGANGSDSAAGTSSAPLATLAAGVDMASACVVLHAGTYNGGLLLEKDLWISGLEGAESTSVDAFGSGAALDLGEVSVRLAGLTLTGGSGSTELGDDLIGGAVQAWQAESLEIQDCVFEGNAAGYGGALFGPEEGELVIERTAFRDNTAETTGGAIYAEAATLEDCTFSGNVAEYGGALRILEATMEGCSFEGNQAEKGGGAYFNGATATLGSSTFTDNEATQGGGAYVGEGGTLSGGVFSGNIAEKGGGLFIRDGSSLSGATLQDNEATRGGGIYADDGITLSGLTVTGNSAEYGGGVLAEDGVDLESSTLQENTASGLGGGALFSGGTSSATEVTITLNEADSIAGGVYAYGGTVTFAGCTFTANTAENGGGLGLEQAEVELSSDTVIDGNDAHSYGGGVYVYASSSLSGGQVSANTALDCAGIFVSEPLTLEGTVVSGNEAEGNGGGLCAIADVSASGVTFEGNLAEQAGAIHAASYTTTLSGCEVLANEAADKGGGARVDGTLVSDSTDWGTGGDDNSPDDIYAGSTYSDYGSGESFTCTSSGCN